MTEAVAALEAVAIVVLLVVSHRERKDLMDRVMARNWGEYRATKTEAPATLYIVSDEDEAELAAAR